MRAPDEGASYAPLSKGPDELISGLLFDASLCAIAPGGALEVGAEWTVDRLGLRSVLQPGGAHYIVPGSCAKSQHGPTGLPGILALGHDLSYSSGSLDGELRARVVGTREADGVTLAIVAIEVELECEADLAGKFKRALEMTEGSQPDDRVAGTSTLVWSSEEALAGTLIWDLTNHRPRELVLEGSVSLKLRFNATLPGLGYRPEMPVVYSVRLDGSIAQEVEVEEWKRHSR